MAKRKTKKIENTTNIEISGGQKYIGEVKVKLVRNNKLVKQTSQHNAGGYPLFSFLVSCLASNFKSSDVPHFIGLGYSNGSVINLLNSVSIPKSSTSISQHSQNIPQVNYQFTIPASYLSTSYLVEGKVVVNTLQLYSSNNVNQKDNYSAQVNLTDKAIITIDPSELQKYTIFITWSLYITN